MRAAAVQGQKNAEVPISDPISPHHFCVLVISLSNVSVSRNSVTETPLIVVYLGNGTIVSPCHHNNNA